LQYHADLAAPIDAVQSGLRDQQQQILDLQSRLTRIDNDNALLKDMLKSLIASQEALRSSLVLGGQDKGTTTQQAKANESVAEKGLNAVQNMNDASLGKELKQRVVECLTALKTTSSSVLANPSPDPASDPNKVLTSCSPDKAKAIADDLGKRRDELVSQWKECRDTLVNSGVVARDDLPDNPANLGADADARLQKNLQYLQQQAAKLKGSQQKCADALNNTLSQVHDVWGPMTILHPNRKRDLPPAPLA
jgi:hypothetical protein